MRNFNFDELKKEKVNTNIIEEGEVSGHFHRINDNVEVFKSVEDDCMLLKVLKETPLTHDEHKTINVFSGNFKKRIVNEYDHLTEETRKVAD